MSTSIFDDCSRIIAGGRVLVVRCICRPWRCGGFHLFHGFCFSSRTKSQPRLLVGAWMGADCPGKAIPDRKSMKRATFSPINVLEHSGKWTLEIICGNNLTRIFFGIRSDTQSSGGLVSTKGITPLACASKFGSLACWPTDAQCSQCRWPDGLKHSSQKFSCENHFPIPRPVSPPRDG